jgi:glycosyltransferase involved in cell wall biosynthesis
VSDIQMRLGLQQRVLPIYRAAFFDALAEVCVGGLQVFAGKPRPSEAIEICKAFKKASLFGGSNRHFLKGAFYLCWQSGLTRWLENWDPNVLIVEANPRYISTPRAIRWMHARKRPVIGWGLGTQGQEKRFLNIRIALRKLFLRGFDALITYSRQGAQDYQALGFSKDDIFVAPNAVAPHPVHPAPERPLQFSKGSPVVLFVGRLQERKKVDHLIRACADLGDKTRPELWIVGDGPARSDLERLASLTYPGTRFFGAQFDENLAGLFRSADLFVLPGTGGLAVQQAMSYALPVIVGDADGTQSELVHTGNGWQLPSGDWHDLSALMQMALSDVARLRQMGMESYRLVSEEINIEKMVEVFARAVDHVRKQ